MLRNSLQQFPPDHSPHVIHVTHQLVTCSDDGDGVTIIPHKEIQGETILVTQCPVSLA